MPERHHLFRRARCELTPGLPCPQARVKSTALVDGGSAALNGPAPGQELLTYLNAPLTRYLPLRRRGSKKSLLSASGPKPGDPIQAGLPAAVPADADAIEELSGAGSCASGLSDEDGSCSIEPQLSAAADADGPVSADEAPVAPAADKGGSAALSPEEAAAAAADAALEAAAEEEEERIAKSKTPVPHLRGQIKLITASPQPIFRKCAPSLPASRTPHGSLIALIVEPTAAPFAAAHLLPAGTTYSLT